MGWGTAIGAGLGGVGGFMVGGPAGAMAGAQLGGMAGGMFGGELNRGDAAEERYGAPDRGNYNVPGYGQAHSQYGNLAGQFAGRQAPQAGQSQFRQGQVGLGQMLAREAGGNGIGHQLIRNQAQGQADRGMQQQMSMASSARPGQGAMGMRNAMMNAGNMNAQVGGQAAQAQGQYQLGAMGQYGGFLQGARGQDDQMSQFNTDARLKQLGLNDQSQLNALQQRLQLQGMQQQGGMGYEQNRAQRYGAMMGAPTSGEQLLSGLGGMGAAYFGSQGR